MAVVTPTQARFLGNIYGITINRGGPEDPGVVEAADQSYPVGAPVYYDANGSMAIVGNGATISKIAGIARKAATGVTGAGAEYRAIVGGDRFVMNIDTSTITQALVGQDCTFEVSGGLLLCEPGGTQADDKPAGVIEKLYTVANGFPDGDATDNTTGRVIVRIVDNTGLQG